MSRVPMTTGGAQRLRDELQQLKSVDRPRVITAISDARAHGDLKENAEYHAAKEQQAFIEGRIGDLEDKLARAQVIDPKTVRANGRVVFGATVTLLNTANKKEVRYQIVGELEADIDNCLISVISPMARALIGKEEGDVVEVQAPGGALEYEILALEYL